MLKTGNWETTKLTQVTETHFEMFWIIFKQNHGRINLFDCLFAPDQILDTSLSIKVSRLSCSLLWTFVYSHDISYHELLLSQGSVELIKAVPPRQHSCTQ